MYAYMYLQYAVYSYFTHIFLHSYFLILFAPIPNRSKQYMLPNTTVAKDVSNQGADLE